MHSIHNDQHSACASDSTTTHYKIRPAKEPKYRRRCLLLTVSVNHPSTLPLLDISPVSFRHVANHHALATYACLPGLGSLLYFSTLLQSNKVLVKCNEVQVKSTLLENYLSKK